MYLNRQLFYVKLKILVQYLLACPTTLCRLQQQLSLAFLSLAVQKLSLSHAVGCSILTEILNVVCQRSAKIPLV